MIGSTRALCWLRAAMGMLLSFAPIAAAHEPTITRAAATFDGIDYRVEIECDLDAFLLDMPVGRLGGGDYAELRALPPAELVARIGSLQADFTERVCPRFDGAKPDPASIVIDFPGFTGLSDHTSSNAPVMGRLVVIQGRVPDHAREFSLFTTDAFDWINLTVDRGAPPSDSDGADTLAIASAQTTDAFRGGEPSPVYALDRAPDRPGLGHIAAQYLVLGFEHILPKGLDHILFVLGLYFLTPRLKPLLMQLTAFTVAHSLTLALSMTGVFTLPSSIVEPLIAASIAYVAIENIFRSQLRATRTLVVFGFGLVHGLGFAGVLTELGLPRGAFLPALISFNVGVELGQISVVLGALMVTGWFRNRDWYRAGAVIPASCMIAALGLYWAVERAIMG